jgi:predicted adenine nucleotide alpha hydrolase (AANH) superfamily ATPase
MKHGMKSPDSITPQALLLPQETKRIVLHACCAPCSSAVIEALVMNGITPHIYFYNPNIYPQDEYLRRKEELIKYLSHFHLPFTEAEYDYGQWKQEIAGWEREPERGKRCLKCFQFRMLATARFAAKQEIAVFATTLTSSRWKDAQTVFSAGEFAVKAHPSVMFWKKDWKKDGLSERRSQIVKLQHFYNQQYCGCEFSMR